MLEIIYELLTPRFSTEQNSGKEEQEAITGRNLSLEQHLRAPWKERDALADKGWKKIEESKAIPWRDLSLEQKYVCLGARLNEKPGKHVAKTG